MKVIRFPVERVRFSDVEPRLFICGDKIFGSIIDGNKEVKEGDVIDRLRKMFLMIEQRNK